MKSIYTLVPDIQHFIETNEDWYEQACSNLHLGRGQRNPDPVDSSKGSLRLSGLGNRCPRALWYSIHRPDLAEPLPYHAKFKYGYGHIIEELALTLARLAGHTVEGEQDELVVDGIVGHRDCVVDGCVLDIKSTSSRGFDKFKNNTLAMDDAFGYLYQLDGYILGSALDPLVTVKDRGFFLAIDKSQGHMILYEHELRHGILQERIRRYREISGLPEPPRCTCGIKPVGSSGNLGLDVLASYSAYKHCCFPELRTFLYKDKGDVKPVHLVKVVRTPDVPELQKFRRDGIEQLPVPVN